MREDRLRTLVSIGFAIVFTLLSYTFFSHSVSLLYAQPPRVAAGLVSGLAGLVFAAAAVTVLRDWLVLRSAEKLEEGGS